MAARGETERRVQQVEADIGREAGHLADADAALSRLANERRGLELRIAAAESAPFQLKQGEFPPEGTSHSIAGELIALDHVNRTGTLRPDRTDAQRRGDWDLPLHFTMLPYGSMRYRGAPATLKVKSGSGRSWIARPSRTCSARLASFCLSSPAL